MQVIILLYKAPKEARSIQPPFSCKLRDFDSDDEVEETMQWISSFI